MKKLPLVTFVYLRYLILEPFRLLELLIYERKIKRTSVDEVIFVLGHWRSGTTHLQQILALDERHTTSSVYQFLFADNFLLTEKWLKPPLNGLCRLFNIPYSFQRIPMDLNLPGELESAMCGILSPNSYTWGHLFPKNYMFWITKFIVSPESKFTENWLDDYEYLIKKFIYASGGKRMIVKSPGDTARISSILKRFPNSKFVYIERNKEEVLRSTNYFWEVIQREISFQIINQNELNQIIQTTYDQVMSKYNEDKHLIKNRLIEIQFEDLIHQPVEQIDKIYSFFNMEKANLEKIQRFLKKQKELRSSV